MNGVFVENPNLPAKKVTLCCVQNAAHIVSELKKLGISTVFTEKNALLDSEVCWHADMQLCHLGGKTVFADTTAKELIGTLKNFGFGVMQTGTSARSPYPADVILNTAVVGKNAFCSVKHTCRELTAALTDRGINIIDVKQGYAKCSVCVIDENSIITEDEAIAAKAVKNGINTLLISKGDIYLSEKHCGFLGGATGKTAPNTLAVTGSLDFHTDKAKIKTFAQSRGVNILELTKGKIIDIGGILPLKEEEA